MIRHQICHRDHLVLDVVASTPPLQFRQEHKCQKSTLPRAVRGGCEACLTTAHGKWKDRVSANVAQSVEQRFRKARVVSSILTVGSILTRRSIKCLSRV
jgi:hypothetical protein